MSVSRSIPIPVPISIFSLTLDKGLSAILPLTLGLNNFFVVRGFPGYYWIFSHIPGLYPLDTNSTSHQSSRPKTPLDICQTFPGEQHPPDQE